MPSSPPVLAMPLFRFHLEASCFLAFLSAELTAIGAEQCTVSASIAWDGDESSRSVMLDPLVGQRFRALIVAALQTYGKDASWQQAGLDGTEYRGSLHSPAFSVPEFRFWSPARDTPPHRLAAAAFGALRLPNAGEPFDELLEEVLRRL